MSEITTFLLQQIAPLWHKRPIGFGISTVLGLLVYHASGYPNGIVIGPLCGLGALAVWIYLHYIPKTEHGKIGVLVAILSEDEKESRQIEADFVSTFRNMLQRDAAESGFQLIVVPKFACIGLNEDVEQPVRLLKQKRGHFMLYGKARKRIVNNKDMHFLDLSCVVRHTPLPKETQQHFANDIGLALPRRVMLPDNNAVFAFEIASQLADLGARYTIGLAAFISGDFGYAERLLVDVEKSLLRSKLPSPGIQHLARAVPELLKQLYDNLLIVVSDEWVIHRDTQRLQAMDDIAAKLLQRDNHHYNSLLTKAIGDLLIRHSVQDALQTIEKCKGSKDPAWRYSLAFLQAYESRLDEAHESYRKAFKGSLQNPTIPVQCEEFMQRVLDREPDKQQMHFCLGLINYNMKHDYNAAADDFTSFVEWDGSTAFPALRDLCERLRTRCQQKNGL
jgi:hypothetical protein